MPTGTPPSTVWVSLKKTIRPSSARKDSSPGRRIASVPSSSSTGGSVGALRQPDRLRRAAEVTAVGFHAGVQSARESRNRARGAADSHAWRRRSRSRSGPRPGGYGTRRAGHGCSGQRRRSGPARTSGDRRRARLRMRSSPLSSKRSISLAARAARSVAYPMKWSMINGSASCSARIGVIPIVSLYGTPSSAQVVERVQERHIRLGDGLVHPLFAVRPHARLARVRQVAVEHKCESSNGRAHGRAPFMRGDVVSIRSGSRPVWHVRLERMSRRGRRVIVRIISPADLVRMAYARRSRSGRAVHRPVLRATGTAHNASPSCPVARPGVFMRASSSSRMTSCNGMSARSATDDEANRIKSHAISLPSRARYRCTLLRYVVVQARETNRSTSGCHEFRCRQR